MTNTPTEKSTKKVKDLERKEAFKKEAGRMRFFPTPQHLTQTYPPRNTKK